MKLYTQYRKHLKDNGSIKKAYFTTFNLSPEFFETYMLPPLLSEDIPDNDFSLEDLNSVLEETKIDIKVFYDASMLALNDKKRTLTKFYPVLMPNGFFHPKVIYLEFEKKVILFVGSGNLTLSGWGRNTEAFKIEEVEKNSNLHKQVKKFFVYVEKFSGLRHNGSNEILFYGNDINFIYSFEEDNAHFLKHLNLESSLYVWSPYFSDKLEKLIETPELSSLEKINIIPDLVKNEKIRLPYLPNPDNEKIKFFREEKDDNIKLNHSKVWISDTRMGIGSYNFTEAALHGKNFEAALVETVDSFDFYLDESFDPTTMNEEELKEESIENVKRYKGVFELTANWETRDITLKTISLVDNLDTKSLKIVMPSNIEKNYSVSLELDTSEKGNFFNALIKNKIFKVKNKDEIIFEGLVLEEETKGFREPLRVETLDEVFSSFIDEKHPTAAKILKNSNINFDRDSDDDLEYRQSKTSYLNYYNLFRGFHNMNQFLKKLILEKDKPHFERELTKFCFTSSSSITAMQLVVENQKKDNRNLFFYLFIDELNGLIVEVNKHLRKDKIEEIDNIDFKLKDKDKDIEFIKAFK